MVLAHNGSYFLYNFLPSSVIVVKLHLEVIIIDGEKSIVLREWKLNSGSLWGIFSPISQDRICSFVVLFFNVFYRAADTLDSVISSIEFGPKRLGGENA
jgi:hypothetical protein